jgi:hypothetical protein
MDRLRAFEVFAAVVANGGFTRAADALNTFPPNAAAGDFTIREKSGYMRATGGVENRMRSLETNKARRCCTNGLWLHNAFAERAKSDLQHQGRVVGFPRLRLSAVPNPYSAIAQSAAVNRLCRACLRESARSARRAAARARKMLAQKGYIWHIGEYTNRERHVNTQYHLRRYEVK